MIFSFTSWPLRLSTHPTFPCLEQLQRHRLSAPPSQIRCTGRILRPFRQSEKCTRGTAGFWGWGTLRLRWARGQCKSWGPPFLTEGEIFIFLSRIIHLIRAVLRSKIRVPFNRILSIPLFSYHPNRGN